MNRPFRFKQFHIHQQRAAMKVGFDGVLLGCWAAVQNAETILDIGTGTGLIALMLAQRNPSASIHAIDIDDLAMADAEQNFAESPWCDRIESQHIGLQEFASAAQCKFDLVVCNPPFFEKNLAARSSSARRTARHREHLELDELFKHAAKLLAEKGSLAVILPKTQQQPCRATAQAHNLCLSRVMDVRPTPTKQPHRVLLQFENGKAGASSSNVLQEHRELYIEMARHQYSPEFVQLARDFYLSM